MDNLPTYIASPPTAILVDGTWKLIDVVYTSTISKVFIVPYPVGRVGPAIPYKRSDQGFSSDSFIFGCTSVAITKRPQLKSVLTMHNECFPLNILRQSPVSDLYASEMTFAGIETFVEYQAA